MLMLQENAYLDNLSSTSYANVARECLSGQSGAQLVMLMLLQNAYLDNLRLNYLCLCCKRMPIWTIWGSTIYAYVARECLSGQSVAQLVMPTLQENAYLDNLGLN